MFADGVDFKIGVELVPMQSRMARVDNHQHVSIYNEIKIHISLHDVTTPTEQIYH